ncbi:De-etiolated protein [Gracilaria domingensis]|nr:De-etiolated protein [Gracilaria domingensis]
MTITFYLLEVSTGVVADRFVLLDDYVRFASHEGVHFYGDMLCILSMRHQLLHIVKIQETLGKFTEERCIGAMCDRDDYQVIARAREAQNSYVAQRQQRTHSVSQQPSLSNQSQNSERDRNVPDPVPAPPPDAEDDDENQPEHNEPKRLAWVMECSRIRLTSGS